MAISRFINYPFVTDATALARRAFAYLQGKVPGWQPSEGQLDTWILEAAADQAADIATLATEVDKGIFRFLGPMFGVQPIEATTAIVATTWDLTDNLGHTIPAGTQVGIRDANGDLVPFLVLQDAIVPGGASATAAGAVLLVAVNPGLASSGLGAPGGNVELIDALAWVASISQVAATAGGQDAETDIAYLDRLAIELQTVSPRPILPNDFAILARNVAGVQRAVAIDGYDPVALTFGNEREITIVAVDATGQPVAAPIKTNIQNYLGSMREINFIVNAMDATMHEIDVTTHVEVQSGYSTADVAARVTSAIEAFLNPAIWGITPTDDPNDPLTWNNLTVIYYLDLANAIYNVVGVERVTLLEMALHGGAQASVDLNLTGVVPLPFTQAADLTVVAV